MEYRDIIYKAVRCVQDGVPIPPELQQELDDLGIKHIFEQEVDADV